MLAGCTHLLVTAVPSTLRINTPSAWSKPQHDAVHRQGRTPTAGLIGTAPEPGGPCGRRSAWIRVSHPRPIPGTPGTIARPTHRSRVDALPVVRATRFVETLDGRKLAYVEFGDPSSPLVIHNHGGPSSRLEGRLLANGATSNGLRLVSVDRPGIGRSTPQKHRSFESWANDLLTIADAL